ncbi:hypothetical protein E1301_Tti021234 [Triplophysa tibetana]|uniref:Uncharacterized protein n=1 Tax=Triplophysa tibetana TaxID=1572043 RepID=A0A5A9PJY2_9TELE|nr:hypothetical protein E1301_Tti021234 [Triplophysa tibetana]
MERNQQHCNKNKHGEKEKRTEHKSKYDDGSAQEDRGDADGNEHEDREEDDEDEQEYREEDDEDVQEYREEDDENEQEYREEDDDEQEYREEDDGNEHEDREEDDEDEQEYREEDDEDEHEDREEDDEDEQEDSEEDYGSAHEEKEEDGEDEQEDKQEDDGNEQEDREEDDEDEQEDREEDDDEQQRVGEEKSQDGDKDSNLLKKQQDDGPVYPGAPLTKGQSLLLLMSYVLRHNLTGVALQDLLTLFNEHFPGLVPATSYLFHKAYGQFGQYVPHFCCINCENYMGPTGIAPKNCSSCNAEFDIENKLRVGSYFLVLSLSAQIVDILENNEIHLDRKESNPGILSDIQCGVTYRKIKQKKKRAEKKRAEKKRAEKKRVEKKRVEKKRVEKKRVEKKRVEKKRVEKKRVEKNRSIPRLSAHVCSVNTCTEIIQNNNNDCQIKKCEVDDQTDTIQLVLRESYMDKVQNKTSYNFTDLHKNV